MQVSKVPLPKLAKSYRAVTADPDFSDDDYINWSKELRRKHVDWPKLHDPAQSWVTCACGNQCAIIPRNNLGRPKDRRLLKLGGDFGSAVARRDRTEALALLHKIEIRSIELITLEKIKRKKKLQRTQTRMVQKKRHLSSQVGWLARQLAETRKELKELQIFFK